MKFTLLIFVFALASNNLQAAEICVTTESDPDGDGYGWEQKMTCLVATNNNDATNSVPQSPAETASQSIFDPRTGSKVDIKRVRWATEDFAGKSFPGCKGYVVDPAQETDQCLSCDTGETYQYEHYEDGNGRLIYSFGKTNFEAEFEWGVDEYGLYYGPMAINAFAEVTESGINQWLDGTRGSIGFYQYCEGVVPASEMPSTDVVAEPIG